MTSCYQRAGNRRSIREAVGGGEIGPSALKTVRPSDRSYIISPKGRRLRGQATHGLILVEVWLPFCFKPISLCCFKLIRSV
jgi:hypothetical protein